MVSRWARDDYRYWMERVYKPRERGTMRRRWYARMTVAGQRTVWALTERKEESARRAAEVWRCVRMDGPEVARAKYGQRRRLGGSGGAGGGGGQGGGAARPVPLAGEPVTIGEFLRVSAEMRVVLPYTWAGYARALRMLAGELLGIPGPGKRASDAQEGLWRAAVESRRLEEVTPARVEEWKRRRYQAAQAVDPVAAAAAASTANSVLRKVRALFAPGVLRDVQRKVALPEPLPLAGVRLFPRAKVSSTVYRGRVEVEEVLREAMADWRGGRGGVDGADEEGEEMLKVLLLAVWTGLRRKEIDVLTWRQVDLENVEGGRLDLKANRWYAYKSQSSQRVVDLHPVLVEILRGMKGRATGEFVVESRVRPRTSRSGQHYRCARVERRLIRWLRERGVEDQKPIHTLRKEFATRLMSQGAATAEVQQILGHADIATTASTYLGVRKRLYPEYGVRAG